MNDMTNEEGSRNNANDGSGANTNLSDIRRTISAASGTLSHHHQPNGSVGGDLSDENNSGAEGSASDDCGDKMAKESDPLQPKMLKSRSANKTKEVSFGFMNSFDRLVFFYDKKSGRFVRM